MGRYLHKKSYIRSEGKTGFTLLELLIVIAIIAILSAILIFVLNPSETLKKGRDAQRMSDLKTMNNALAFVITTVPSFDSSTLCTIGASPETPNIHISFPNTAPGFDMPPMGPGPADCGDRSFSFPTDTPLTAYNDYYQVSNDNLRKIDGNGWITVNFGGITSGSPISRLVVDPTNDITLGTAGKNPQFCHANVDRAYIYTCYRPSLVWEINASLESKAFGPGGGTNMMTKDGGDSDFYWEVGTNLHLLPVD